MYIRPDPFVSHCPNIYISLTLLNSISSDQILKMFIRSFYALDLLLLGCVFSSAAITFFNLDIMLSGELDSKREVVEGRLMCWGVIQTEMVKKVQE